MKKKVIIVDSDDTPIALKFRDEIDPVKDIYRVTGIWLTNPKGEILISQRAFSKKIDPGKWGPAVAGTVEEGDTYESNAYKELAEEIGVTGVFLSAGPKLYVQGPRHYFAQWYTCEIDKPSLDFVVQAEEVVQVKWIAASSLRSDVEANPESYTPSMKLYLDMFVGGQ